jgi:phospholipase/carboxylesterase
MRRGILAGLQGRWREADGLHAPLVILLHGLSGDEDVMWVFEPAFPRAAGLLALRAPFAFPGGGYSWVDPEHGPMPAIPAFADAAQAIARAVSEAQHGGSARALVLAGFSQGAALALSAVALGRMRPAAVVALAGILPAGDLAGLKPVPIFWAHGQRDEVVPVERARRDAERLRQAGASLTYCEADVGHKLGAECFKGLQQWFASLSVDLAPRGA